MKFILKKFDLSLDDKNVGEQYVNYQSNVSNSEELDFFMGFVDKFDVAQLMKYKHLLLRLTEIRSGVRESIEQEIQKRIDKEDLISKFNAFTNDENIGQNVVEMFGRLFKRL